MKIGIFDSGVGGLSVLRLAAEKMPDADFIYYADTDNVPYGEKSEDEVRRLVVSAAEFLVEHGANAIVLACNTATSAAAALLRETLSVPVIGMEPAVKKALEEHPGGRVIAAATPLTCRGGKLRELISRVGGDGLVDTLPLPGLVRLAEKCEFSCNFADTYIRSELARFDLSKYSSLVLGCTHFLYFTDAFRRVLPDSVTLTDGNEGTVNQLMRVLGDIPPKGAPSTVEYYTSGAPASESDLKKAHFLLSRLDELNA